MINLNKKIKRLQIENNNDRTDGKYEVMECIDEAVSFYLDARDYPEKHPELVQQCYPICDVKKIIESKELLSIIRNSFGWRDWLFKKIFEGGK